MSCKLQEFKIPKFDIINKQKNLDSSAEKSNKVANFKDANEKITWEFSFPAGPHCEEVWGNWFES